MLIFILSFPSLLNSLLSPLNTAIYFRPVKVLHFPAATGARRSAVPRHCRNGVFAGLLFPLKKTKHVVISLCEIGALGWMRQHYIQNM